MFKPSLSVVSAVVVGIILLGAARLLFPKLIAKVTSAVPSIY